MDRNRRTVILAFTLAALGAPLVGRSQQPRAGVDYQTLKTALPVEVPGRVEVIEFFWYGCPHCYALEPVLETWIKKLPGDVHFLRIPAVFNERWAHDAAIFYAFDAMGLVEKLHRPLFDAIHRDGLRTDDPEALGQWLQRHGVDRKRFEQTLGSFGVRGKVRLAAQLSVSYQIDGTPAMAVQGRYTVPAGEHMLDTVDDLIEQTRKTIRPAGADRKATPTAGKQAKPATTQR